MKSVLSIAVLLVVGLLGLTIAVMLGSPPRWMKSAEEREIATCERLLRAYVPGGYTLASNPHAASTEWPHRVDLFDGCVGCEGTFGRAHCTFQADGSIWAEIGGHYLADRETKAILGD